jgi:DNA transformation protein
MADDFIAWCSELLSCVGRVRVNRMFGARGFYVDDLFVAIVSGECLYLKVDDTTRAQFEAAGGERFVYTTAKGEHGSLSYFSTPAEAMDSPAQMLPWARLAVASALRARASKPSPKPRAKPASRANKAARKPG